MKVWRAIPRIWVRLGSAGLGVSMLMACGNQNDFKPPPPPKVTVAHPLMQEFRDSLEFTGNTQPLYTVQLRARVEGYLEKVLFKEGDLVEEGKVLFQIQQEFYKAKLKEAQAQVLSAKAQLMHSETEFKRFTGLFKQDAAAQTDVDRWHYQRDSDMASVMAAESQVDIAKLNLSYTTVKAPFRGRVSRRFRDPGNVVGHSEETVLAEINRIDPLYVYFTISEQELLKIRRVQTQAEPEGKGEDRAPNVPVWVGLANEEGFPHQAMLDYADIQVDNATGTLQLRATLPNPDAKILPGLFVRIKGDRPGVQNGLVLPQEAVAYDQGGAYVLVVDDKHIVARRAVTPGPQLGGKIAIDEGVQETDWVITNGLLRAIPGRPVDPVQDEPSK